MTQEKGKRDDRFAVRSEADLLALVRHHPMAWIVSGQGDDFLASLMPVRPWQTEADTIISLASHLPRANPQVAQLERSGEAHMLFLGPHDYISPSWLDDRSQAPTWNFISARFRVAVEFMTAPEDLRTHLEDLVGAMEAGRDNAWQIADMGARYETLAARIRGFVAHVREARPRFKLGQDERRDVFADMCRGLEQAGNRELFEWMRAFDNDGD